jgi:SAM-dependent methyltransferase
MIGRRDLPQEYLEWNERWGAPGGYRHGGGPQAQLADPDPARFGPFAFQLTSQTREFEYPWVYHAAAIKPGLRVLDVGAGLSGLQFVLGREGCEVVNVDPSAAEAPSEGWQVRAGWWLTPDRHQALNQAFDTDVTLVPRRIQDSGLAPGSFDRVLCVSVLEHVGQQEARSMLESMIDLLAPGGLCVLTVDLFLDLKPFGILDRNEWGTNLDLGRLLGGLSVERDQGDPRELLGFPEFDYDAVVAQVDDYLLGGYPCVAQALVLRKPAAP